MTKIEDDRMTLRLKYWFKRAISLLNREPQNIKELVNYMKDMEAHQVISADTLSMMEKIANLSETKVADVMVPAHEMVTINDDASFDMALSITHESGHSRF